MDGVWLATYITVIISDIDGRGACLRPPHAAKVQGYPLTRQRGAERSDPLEEMQICVADPIVKR